MGRCGRVQVDVVLYCSARRHSDRLGGQVTTSAIVGGLRVISNVNHCNIGTITTTTTTSITTNHNTSGLLNNGCCGYRDRHHTALTGQLQCADQRWQG